MGYEYQEKFVDKANEILANQMKTKPEWIDRKTLIKALEADFNTDWDDYASKNNFGKDYIDGVRDEYDDVLTIICKQRNLTDEETEIYNSWIEAEATDVQPVDRWISFKDKQPQEGGFYLTYYAEHIRVSQWFPSKNWYNEHGGNVTNMVEYWQPLPEPPKQ